MHDDEQVDYRQWGQDFFQIAVSEDRLLGAVNDLAGQPIDFGPMGVGPGRLAKLRAYGSSGAAQAIRLPVPITVSAVALDGLRIFVDPPRLDVPR